MLLAKPRAYAEVYNDLDGEVCNVFRVLRDPCHARELARALHLTLYARAEHELSYQPSADPIEQARRTIVRSQMSFGSDGVTGKYVTGFRAHTRRSGTTPAEDWANYPPFVAQFAERLRGVVIENRPALDVIRHQDDFETLFYLDPPYPHSTRSVLSASSGAKHRYRYEMTDNDHRDLGELVQDCQGMVIISGYGCDLYDNDLFRDWKRIEKATHGDGAVDRVEVLWLNKAAARGLSQQALALEGW